MSLKTQAAKRRASFVELEQNPIEAGSNDEVVLQIESLADTVQIEKQDLDNLISTLEGLGDNAARIRTLRSKKTPYQFSSEDLLKILAITASVKTKISFICEIGPRLVDPKAKSAQIIEMFRYSEEKRQVEEVLKARSLTVAKQTGFSRPPPLAAGRGAGRGRGGRGGSAGGRGGRGRGMAAPHAVAPTAAVSSNQEPEDGVECKPSLKQPETVAAAPAPQVSEPKTPPKSPDRNTDNISSTPGSADPVAPHTPNGPAATPSSVASGVDSQASPYLSTASTSPSPAARTGRRLSTHRLSGGSTRRKSSIVVSTSVMASLGLVDIDDVSLGGVPMELWESKARHSSQGVDVSLAEEDRLREIARAKLRAEEEERLRQVREAQEEANAAENKRRVEEAEEEAAGAMQHSQPFAWGGANDKEADLTGDHEKGVDVGGGIEGETTEQPAAGVTSAIDASGEIDTENECPPSQMSTSGETDPSVATAGVSTGSSGDAVDSEPLDSTTPTEVVAAEDMEGSGPSGVPITDAADEAQADTAELSSDVAIDAVPTAVDGSGTSDAPGDTAPQGQESSEEVAASPSTEFTGQDDAQPSGWRRVVKRMSGVLLGTSPAESAPPSDGQEERPIDVPHNPKQARQPRSSLEKLREEKKVGTIMGFFEGLVKGGSGANDKKKEDEPSADVDKKQATTSGVSLPVDERMLQYQAMVPEKSLGVDPASGRVLYSYHELVRRNYTKDYDTVSQHELEEHMSDGEFLMRLNMTKDEFRTLPKWRRTERKKTLMLF